MRFVLLLARVAVAASLPLFDDAPGRDRIPCDQRDQLSAPTSAGLPAWYSRLDGMTVLEAKRLMGVPADSKAYLPPAKDIQPAKADPGLL